MFCQIFIFEIKYRLKRPDSYLYFLGFFTITVLAFANGAVPSNGKTFVNAPIVLTKFFTIFSLFMMVVTAAIMGAPIYRDLEYNTHEYYLSYPITRNGYFWGRFLGSFLFVLLIGSTLIWGSMTGIFLGPKLGWLSPDLVGPFNLKNFFQPFIIFALPNLLLTSAVFFGLVAYTRTNKVIYSGGVLFYLGYIMSIFAFHFFNNKNIAYWLDAFGFVPMSLQEQYFSPDQLNHSQIPIHGMILLNRLVWSAVGVSIIGLTWLRFNFVRFFSGMSDKKVRKKQESELYEPTKTIPKVSTNFAGQYKINMIFSLAKIEWLSIVRDNYFRLILGVGTFFLGFLFWMGAGRQFNVPDLPRTVTIMDIYDHNFIFFIFLIIIFYTGETVHREKTTRFAIINDALPPPDWVLYGSKLIALFFLALLLATVPMLTGICIQLAKGFDQLNLPAYLITCYGLSLPMFIEMLMFCFAVHVLINNKFAGHALGLIIWVIMLLGYATGRFDYRLMLYSYTPDYWVTDMDGLGPTAAPQIWFNLYWLFAGGLLVVVGAMFYYRGVIADFKERARLAFHRFNRTAKRLAIILIAAFLTTGAFNYYNVSYLNSWLFNSEKDQRAAAFEKILKKYDGMPLPGITRFRLFMDIFPESRKIVTRAFATIINNNNKPISQLLLDGDQLTEYSLKYNGEAMEYSKPLIYSWPRFTFFKHGMDTSMYRLYKFSKTLQPGDTALVEINSLLEPPGFSNNFTALSTQHNGTAFNSYLPEMGYDKDEELSSNSVRKKYGLTPKNEEELPLPGDSLGMSELAYSSPAGRVDFEATLSTSKGQTAIAPGKLDSTWTENGRNYFHYSLNKPKTYSPFPVLSGKYSVMKERAKLESGRHVDIEFDYHHSHTANLGRFMAAYKEGLVYFSKEFGEYPFDKMRLIEAPGFINSAAFPNSLIYGEYYAWNAGFTTPDQFDYCYFFTAYRLGYQWWRFQVAPNHTQGAQSISEGLSKYGALMLYEKRFGKNNMREILSSEVWWYLLMHRYRYQKENPLLIANRDYVWDTKAGVLIYGLRDLIGEDSLNKALREFHDAFTFRDKPPYAGSNDLYKILTRYVPDSLQYYLKDSWERITIYNNKVVNVTIKPVGKNNEWKVHLEFSVHKSYADSSGNEKDAGPMNDYIDIGVFAANTKSKDGRSIVNPLYFQKHKFSAGNYTIDIIVNGKPASAGIDPYCKLIDQNQGDNIVNF
ncbi:MAG: ABC transporter permease subunit [Chitinophagales bacterium]